MRSLRTRLLLGSVAGTALLLLVAGVTVYVLVRARLLAQFDTSLSATAGSLALLVEQEHDRIELDFSEGVLETFQPGERPEYFQVWLTDGAVLARSPSLGAGGLERFAGRGNAPAHRWVTLPDGRQGRAAGITFHPRQDAAPQLGLSSHPPLTLVVARETAEVHRTLGVLRLLLTAVGAAATVLLLFVLAGVIRSGLKPLDALAAQIGRLGEDDLRVRVDSGDAPVELSPVVERLNDLLHRLERAFAQHKSITANVAHELRTPLAGLQSTLEVALSQQREPADYREAMSECLLICQRMQRMVDSLLCLARVEAGQAVVHAQSVRLSDLLRDCWRPLAERARARGLQVQWDVDPQLVLNTDLEKAALILSNVLDNAVNYADAGGNIRIQAVSRIGRTDVSISNTGSQLSQEEAEHVFERFWRADTARGATGLHCGLGLSLCRQLVDMLGGSIRVESKAGGTFRVILSFDRHRSG